MATKKQQNRGFGNFLYGIWTGCIHEGGGCDSKLYASKEQARKVAIELVNIKIYEYEQQRKDPNYVEIPGDHEWKERHPDYWHNNCDGISIQEFTVQN